MREEILVERSGWVVGQLSFWIPAIVPAQVGRYRVDSTDGIVTWKRYLSVGKQIPKRKRHVVAQISNMVLFDFLINNPDRWSGGNAYQSRDRSVVYFIDNTMSFGARPVSHRRTKVYLRRVQKFSRALIGRLRTLQLADLQQALSSDIAPFEYVLTKQELDAVIIRQKNALAYVDDLIARHGEQVVLAFP